MRFTFGKKHICTYCGEPADTIDHTIPYSFFRDKTEGNRRKKESVGFMTYCCRECNNALGDRLFYTFQDRCKFVNKYLRKKYKKHMGVVWDQDELETLSGSLRQEIERSNRLNLRLRERVGWQESDGFMEILNEAMERVYFSTELQDEWKEFFIDTDYKPEYLDD